jgi:hypothetical protein
MSQSQTGFEMVGHETKECLIVYLCQVVVTLLGMDIGPKVKRRKILLVCMEYLTVLRECIVPLLKIDIGLRLTQTEVNIGRSPTQLLCEHLQRVTPLLTGLCTRRQTEQVTNNKG